MNADILCEMGLYKLEDLLRQLQGFNKAFYAYVDSNDTGTSDPKARELIATVSNLINAEETIITKARTAADNFIDAIEHYGEEVQE